MTDPNDHVLVALPVDQLQWTKHWLGNRRCDYLLIKVATSPDVPVQIHIRAVESKVSLSADPVPLNVDRDPFREGVDQVLSTLDSLWLIVEPDSYDRVLEDLRFSAFAEHVTSAVLAVLYPFKPGDRSTAHVLRVLTAFSQRKLAADAVEMDGEVVCTQPNTGAAAVGQEIQANSGGRMWRVILVRTGSPHVQSMLGDGNPGPVLFASRKAGRPSGPIAESGRAGTNEASRAQGQPSASAAGAAREPEGLHDGAEQPADEAASSPSAEPPADEAASSPPPAGADHGPTSTLPSRMQIQPGPSQSHEGVARDLYLACRQRGFAVHEPSGVTAGPALIAVSMALEAGASIRPMEVALEDLAREVGVGTIEVENDPSNPFHVRFLVERLDRTFPTLPAGGAPFVDLGQPAYGGLYLGQTLEGRDYLSFLSGWPHMLIGGSTGSGKTTFIRSLLAQISRPDAAGARIILVDGKGEVDYMGVVAPERFQEPFSDVVVGSAAVLNVFDWVIEEEIPRRRALIIERAKERIAAGQTGPPAQARDLLTKSLADDTGEDPFPALVIVVDEFAEIMLEGGPSADAFERRVQQISQIGRSSLVHLVLATQRPDSSVVKGAIKANLDARVALRLPTHHDSMTILGRQGAERLLGRGDLILMTAGSAAVRLQGYSS